MKALTMYALNWISQDINIGNTNEHRWDTIINDFTFIRNYLEHWDPRIIANIRVWYNMDNYISN